MDFAILDWIQNNIRNDLLDSIIPWITKLGDFGIIWIVGTLILICIPKTRKVGIVIGVCILIEIIACNLIIKPVVARVRPYDVNGFTDLLIKAPHDYSFPSGHTGAAFAVVGALLFSKNKYWIPVCVLAFMIAFSRLYLYVHYPTDVAAGAIIGLLSGWLGVRLVGRKKLACGEKHQIS